MVIHFFITKHSARNAGEDVLPLPQTHHDSVTTSLRPLPHKVTAPGPALNALDTPSHFVPPMPSGGGLQSLKPFGR